MLHLLKGTSKLLTNYQFALSAGFWRGVMIRCSVLLILSFGLSVFSATEERINQFLPKFESYIQKNLPVWAIPGMAVVVVTKDKVLLCKGFGTREVGKIKPVNKHTVFQIASLTKNFTASLAGILEKKKFFSLHDLAKTHLPKFMLSNSDITNKVTLADLMGHRVGFESFSGDTLMKAGYSPEEIMDKFHLIPIEQRFRKDYSYSNQMFGFMGLVIESTTQKKYAELVSEYIYAPLEMKDSSAGATLIEQENSLWNKIKKIFGCEANIALCHDKNLEGNAVCIGLDPLIYVYPSTSGINTSAHDLGIWLQCQLNNGKLNGVEIIPEDHIQAMRQPVAKHTKVKPRDLQFPPELMRNISYGMGWFVYDYGPSENSIQVLEHHGGYSGQRSTMFMCPTQGFAVGILSNLGHFNVNLFPEALRNFFINSFLGLEERDWSAEYAERKNTYLKKIHSQRANKKLLKPTPKRDDNSYLGVYKNDLYGEMRIEKDSKGLLLKIKDRSCHIVHWNGDEFSINGWEFNGNMSRSDPHFIEFGVNEKGQMLAYVSFLHEGNDPIFVKNQ